MTKLDPQQLAQLRRSGAPRFSKMIPLGWVNVSPGVWDFQWDVMDLETGISSGVTRHYVFYQDDQPQPPWPAAAVSELRMGDECLDTIGSTKEAMHAWVEARV